MKQKAKKFFNYIFDTKGLRTPQPPDQISAHALQAAGQIRGAGRAPAILLQGIMKRSGTVYVGDMLALHPALEAYPNMVWEIPFLNETGKFMRAQDDFFLNYRQNVGKIDEHDFLPLFGEAFIAYLHAYLPPEKRMLLKVPGVEYLNAFYSVFPHENLLLQVRDGRDVVHSTVKTWPQITFSMACRRWNLSAQTVLHFHARNKHRTHGYWLARFEDAVNDPPGFIQEACQRFGLDESAYPFEKIGAIPVQGSSSFKTDGKVDYWIEKPKTFNPIGRWEKWSVWRKAIFKLIAGKSLIALGYAEDSRW